MSRNPIRRRARISNGSRATPTCARAISAGTEARDIPTADSATRPTRQNSEPLTVRSPQLHQRHASIPLVMKILSPSLLVFACVTVAWAQDAVTTTSPILTEKQSREAAPPRKILPPAPHEISPETTAKIRADLPSYTQPKSVLARDSEPGDTRES